MVVGIFMFSRIEMYMVKNRVSSWLVLVRLSSRVENCVLILVSEMIFIMIFVYV